MDSTLLILVFGGQNYNTVPNKIQLNVNKSMQVGDVVYKVSTPSSTGGITTADSNGSSTFEKLGIIKQITDWNNGNGAASTNYGTINGTTSTGIANAMFPIDLNNDGSSEIGNDSIYWESGWTDTEPISITTSGFGSFAVVIDNTGFDTVNPTINDYYFFAKDNSVNLTSMTGYYGEVEFKNNSTSKAELFSIACDIAESSK